MSDVFGRCEASIKVDAGDFGPYQCWKHGSHAFHEAEIPVYTGGEESERGMVKWPNKGRKHAENRKRVS